MSDVLTIAEGIAREAHSGKLYADGRDYVEAHLEPVAGLILRLGYPDTFQATGWLHDVVEDTDITLPDLSSAGIPTEVVVAVGLLTKKGEPHPVYLEKIARDAHATVGKYADSVLNLANTALGHDIKHSVYVRHMRTYSMNIAKLAPRLPIPTF